MRDYERVFANDRRSFRNGITNTKRYPQAQHKNTATPIPCLPLNHILEVCPSRHGDLALNVTYLLSIQKTQIEQADTHKDTCLLVLITDYLPLMESPVWTTLLLIPIIRHTTSRAVPFCMVMPVPWVAIPIVMSTCASQSMFRATCHHRRQFKKKSAFGQTPLNKHDYRDCIILSPTE